MRSTVKNVALPILVACGLLFGAAHGNAQVVLSFAFNANAQNFENFTWSATGPAGWPGGAAIQAPAAVGGWTLGNGFDYRHEFNYFSGEQPVMQQFATAGNGWLTFDVLVDGTSFTPGVANWYHIHVAGNSGGANAWTPIEKVSGDAWHNADDNTLYTTHVELTFAQLGWNDTFDQTGWFQIYFGANSDSDFPVRFYIDNVRISAIPDPRITVEPVGGTIGRGATISLGVTATGLSALSYQWKHDGVALTNGGNILGANTASLTISNAQLSHSGEYTVTVSDAAGSVVSQPAQLIVLCVIPNEGDAFVIRSFAGNTNGYYALTWDSCGDHLYEVQTSEALPAESIWTSCAVMIGGDGTTTWVNTNAHAADHRFYRVQRFSFEGDQDGDGLSNLDEFSRHTNVRNADSDGDGMPDGWEVQYGLEPLDPADAHADLDGDGYASLQEYQLHTRPNASYSQPAHLPHGLVAWWKLDEGTGTNVFDSSLNGHHGYVLGGNPTGAWTTGYLSNAVTLGGPANNWVQVPYHASLTPVQEFTLMGWVKPSGHGTLIANWDSVGQVYGNYWLQFWPDNIELRFSPAGNGSYSTLQFNPNWSTNDWHHVAVCYRNGTNVAVFVDGEWRAGQSVTDPFVPVPNPILIGFPGLTNAYSVDDVRIYNRALTTNEIASLSRGNGLPVNMIVGQTATLRAFGASEGDTCQWSIVSGQGFFTNTVNLTTEFRPKWSGAVSVRAIWARSGILHTNLASTTVSFPGLSPIAGWNAPNVQPWNNCYNFSTDIRTDTFAQPGVGGGSPGQYPPADCQPQTGGVMADGLQGGVNLADLCHTSELPQGHIIALLVWPYVDFHFARMEADGTWSHKPGNLLATTLDNSGQPITDPRTANFGSYQFCSFFWVGPDVHIR